MKNIIICFLLSLASCNNQSRNEISNYIKEHCNKFPCTIKMQNIINAKWDKMYVFKENASLEKINEVLGFKYNKYFGDIGQRIIFTKDTTVIYYEDEFPSVEGYKEGELVFELEDSIVFKEFNIKEANFTVNEVSNNNGKYYLLKH